MKAQLNLSKDEGFVAALLIFGAIIGLSWFLPEVHSVIVSLVGVALFLLGLLGAVALLRK
jgi:hypothetical protein